MSIHVSPKHSDSPNSIHSPPETCVPWAVALRGGDHYRHFMVAKLELRDGPKGTARATSPARRYRTVPWQHPCQAEASGRSWVPLSLQSPGTWHILCVSHSLVIIALVLVISRKNMSLWKVHCRAWQSVNILGFYY